MLPNWMFSFCAILISAIFVFGFLSWRFRSFRKIQKDYQQTMYQGHEGSS